MQGLVLNLRLDRCCFFDQMTSSSKHQSVLIFLFKVVGWLGMPQRRKSIFITFKIYGIVVPFSQLLSHRSPQTHRLLILIQVGTNNIEDMQAEGPETHNTLNYHSQETSLPQHPTKVQQLQAAISLSVTMPPSKLRKNLIGLTTLAPEIEDILLQKVDLPIQIEDADPDHLFLKTEFNRDGDSYRSPHTNAYIPKSEDGYVPEGQLRKMQELGNILLGQYTKLYYGNKAVGSFYVSDSGNPDQFSCGYFAKKCLEPKEGEDFRGNWDSFNVVDINFNGDEATFELATTILIEMDVKSEKQGTLDMTGFMKKKKTEKRKIGKQKYEESLIAVGEMIEEVETIMRQNLQAVYIIRMKQTIFSTRYEYTVEYEKQRRHLAEGLKQIHLKG